MEIRSSFWEHESLANYLVISHFQYTNCVSNCILKTKIEKNSNEKTTVTVYAHGFRVEERISYVSVLGGDGKHHRVSVYWNEYLPVTGIGSMYIKEDNSVVSNDDTSHIQRMHHVSEILNSGNYSLYRKHIASKL